ncbi:hypothetical protein C8R44DRAFT_598751, partial [Mycena epipterygia]
SESMGHIITQCDAPGQNEIWALARELWEMKTGDILPKLVMGQIMACAANTRGDVGTSRLFRILISESAHLIWRLRCERVIQEKEPTSQREIRSRWLKSMNNRLGLDCALTNESKYRKKAIDKLLVPNTWCKVLNDGEHLPKDWTRKAGVLVGIGYSNWQYRRRGRNFSDLGCFQRIPRGSVSSSPIWMKPC